MSHQSEPSVIPWFFICGISDVLFCEMSWNFGNNPGIHSLVDINLINLEMFADFLLNVGQLDVGHPTSDWEMTMTFLGWQTTARLCLHWPTATSLSQNVPRTLRHICTEQQRSKLVLLFRFRFHFRSVWFDLKVHLHWVKLNTKRRRFLICIFEMQCAVRSWYFNWSVGSQGAQDNIRGNGLNDTTFTFSWPWSGHCGGRPWPSADTIGSHAYYSKFRVPTFSDWQNSMIFPWFSQVF